MLKTFLALERHSGRKDKERILREAGRDPDFKSVLAYALNPYLRFHVRKIGDVKNARRSAAPIVASFRLLDRLAARDLTGHDARDAVRQFMAQLNADDAEVFWRMLTKDLRCGVHSKLVNTVFPGLIPEYALQLAAPFDPEALSWPVYGELKLDGMRVTARIDAKAREVEWLSRGGRPVKTMDHLSAHLLRLYPKGMVLDGEGRVPGTFQKSISAVKRDAPKAGAPAEFHVFDALRLAEFDERRCDLAWLERRERLKPIVEFGHAQIRVTAATRLSSVEQATALFARARADGHEGLVLKAPLGKYRFKRSRDWMKMKAEETMDVDITGFIEGDGKYRGMLGALAFEHKGQRCRAGTGFSDAQRKSFWRRRKSLLGVVMEVEFTELTDGGRTRHARFLRLREHDGERD